MAFNNEFYKNQLNDAKSHLVSVELKDADGTSYGRKTISWGTPSSDGTTGAKVVASDIVWSIPANALLGNLEFYDATSGGVLQGIEATSGYTYAGSGTYTVKALTLRADNKV